MMNVMIEYANSAGDRWAAWVVAASLDAAVLLALDRPGVVRHSRSGRAAGGLLSLPAGAAQVAGARGRDGSGRHGAMDSFGPGVVVVQRRLTSPRGSKADRRLKRRSPRSRRIGQLRRSRGSRPPRSRSPSRRTLINRRSPTEARPSRQAAPAADALAHPLPTRAASLGAGDGHDRLACRCPAAVGRLARTQLRFRARLRARFPSR